MVFACGPLSPASSHKITSSPDVEMLEGRVEHAVFVKVNLAAIHGFDEAIAFLRKQSADSRVPRWSSHRGAGSIRRSCNCRRIALNASRIATYIHILM
jgi:hypothetical protein